MKIFQEIRMGKITDQAKSEIKQLPLMIGKVLGGILAVISFSATVVIVTRKVGHTLADVLPSTLMGGLGIIIFVLSSRLLTRRLSESQADTLKPDDLTRTSMLSWVILLLLATIFLLCTYFITK
jgi:hypothetical protein